MSDFKFLALLGFLLIVAVIGVFADGINKEQQMNHEYRMKCGVAK